VKSGVWGTDANTWKKGDEVKQWSTRGRIRPGKGPGSQNGKVTEEKIEKRQPPHIPKTEEDRHLRGETAKAIFRKRESQNPEKIILEPSSKKRGERGFAILQENKGTSREESAKGSNL